MLTVAALALPSVAGDLELSLRGGPEGSAGGAASQVVVRPSPSPPRWVADPLSPPAFTVR
jgi:hypothetical protein